jgi:transposase
VAVLYLEGLYRSFANRREVAAYAGLVPTPWRSGTIDREQGLSKAGNRLRHIMIELAWLWVRHQPDSALTAGSALAWAPNVGGYGGLRLSRSRASSRSGAM